MDKERAVKIAAINDRFRGMAVDVTVTQGVIYSLSNVVGLLIAIEGFSDFDEDNDPYGEHDFGSLIWEDEKVFWKTSYIKVKLFLTWPHSSTYAARITSSAAKAAPYNPLSSRYTASPIRGAALPIRASKSRCKPPSMSGPPSATEPVKPTVCNVIP
jgi:hypothetical protein